MKGLFTQRLFLPQSRKWKKMFPFFILLLLLFFYQADYYNYIVKSYLKNISKAQQAGITVWGINDNLS